MTDHGEIALTFNEYFNKKTVDLNNNIDPNLIEDPLEKIKVNANKTNQPCKFNLNKTGLQPVSKPVKQILGFFQKGFYFLFLASSWTSGQCGSTHRQ